MLSGKHGGTMYQIIGTLRNGQQRLVATTETAAAAREHYSASVPLFHSVAIVDPSGATIEAAELSRRADEGINA